MRDNSGRSKISPYVYVGLEHNSIDDIRGVILNLVHKYLGITEEQIVSKCRLREYVQARQICMYMESCYTKSTLKEIAKAYDRDHSTVIHAKQIIRDREYVKDPIVSVTNKIHNYLSNVMGLRFNDKKYNK